MPLELKAHQKHLIFELARYEWWRSPLDAAKNPDEVIALVMNKGNFEDCVKLLKYFDEKDLASVLNSGQARDFDRTSWVLWQIILNGATLGAIADIPKQSFWQSAVNSIRGPKVRFSASITTAKLFAKATLSERLVQMTQSSQKPIFDDIMKKLLEGESLTNALLELEKKNEDVMALLRLLCEIDSMGYEAEKLCAVSNAIKGVFEHAVEFSGKANSPA